MLLQKKVMADLTSRIKDYYETINKCRYMATTTFMLRADIENQYRTEIMNVVDALRLRCALFKDIEVKDIQLEVHLESKEPYAYGWVKTTGAFNGGWTFEEYWILKDNTWYNKNLFPKLG